MKTIKQISGKRAAKTAILLILATAGFWILQRAGIEPLWAAAGFLFMRSVIRFIFRLAVVLVSLSILIALICLLLF
jgi:hypothetical protein